MEQAKVRFAVANKFPRFFQRQSAQWAEAKHDCDIKVLWHLLKEAGQQSQAGHDRK
jgi:hypothetical protein